MRGPDVRRSDRARVVPEVCTLHRCQHRRLRPHPPHSIFSSDSRVSGRARVRGACPHRRSRVSRVARALPRLRRIAADRAGAARRPGARVRARASGLSAPCNCTACASSPEAVPPLVCGTLTREPNESLDAPGLPKMPLMPARRSQLSPILHRAGRCLRTPCSVSVSSRS